MTSTAPRPASSAIEGPGPGRCSTDSARPVSNCWCTPSWWSRCWPCSPPCRWPGAGGWAGPTSGWPWPSTSSPAWASPSGSTATSPTARSRPPGPADRAGDRGQPGHAGADHHLGRRPPPPPRLHRQGGRPALAVAVRHQPGSRWPSGFWHAHLGWLFDRDHTNPHGSPPTCWPTATSAGSTGSSSRWSLVSLARSGRARRADHLVVVGRGDRVLLGRAGAGRGAAPRHLVDQLDLPHDRRPAVRPRRDRSTNFWPLAIVSMGESWHNLHHADPTCARHGVGRGQIDMSARVICALREARLGLRGPLAHRRDGWPASSSDSRTSPQTRETLRESRRRPRRAAGRGRIDRPMTSANGRTHGYHQFMTVVETAVMMWVPPGDGLPPPARWSPALDPRR